MRTGSFLGLGMHFDNDMITLYKKKKIESIMTDDSYRSTRTFLEPGWLEGGLVAQRCRCLHFFDSLFSLIRSLFSLVVFCGHIDIRSAWNNA